MSGQKVVPMKKRFRPNLAFFILILIVAYVLILGWNYITKEHISIYEVNSTQISDDSPLYGFILRSEEVVTAEGDGHVNYYNPEGSRIGVGKVVYTLDENGEINEMLEGLQRSTENRESISSLRETIASFQNSFTYSDYTQVSNFAATVESVLLEQSRDNLFQILNQQIKSKGMGKNYVQGISKKSGILAYSIDGFETTEQKDITPELFDQYASVSKKRLQNEGEISKGEPVYKLITNNDWSLVIQLDDTYYEELYDQNYVRVTIDKDNLSFNAAVSLFDQNGVHFARLQTSRYMEHYINDRFLKISLNLKSAAGLKIPNSSILEKEFFVLPAEAITNNNGSRSVVKQISGTDGKISYTTIQLSDIIYVDGTYYVDSAEISGGDVLLGGQGETYILSAKQALQGVYCVNEGYCEFRPVEIIYQNKEYTIISDSTTGGLATYDHIVVDPANLESDDFIE